MQRLPKVRGSTRLFRTRLLLMSDSGGQPNYLDVFPLFVRNKCLALFTLKLNERLDAIPQFSYCIRGHSISMADTRLQHSSWQLLESLAKSMSSFLPSLMPSSEYHGNPRFAVIGTFADRMHECVSESLDDKNTSLAQRLKAYEPLRINYKGKPILPVNAVIEDKKQKRQDMKELRRLISQSPSVKVTIKLRWFGFYLSLLSSSKGKQRAILSLQECLDIGRSLDMDQQETRKAITFFLNLNLVCECVSDSLVDKNTSLAQSLKDYEPLQINHKGKPIFPVNAVIEDKKQRKQYMKELRRLISKSPSIKVTIKLRWFGFYLSLLSSSKAEQRAILSLQECVDIGRSLDMDEQETRKAITFFHNLNLILHYQSLVIVNLKPILDLVSLLIGVSFINEDELHDLFGIDLPAGDREHFQQHGCLDRPTLAECFQFPRLLNAETFINLLAEVKAVAIIEKSNEFFMPCVLRYASKEKEREITADLEQMCPWIVRLMTQVGSRELCIPLPPAFSPTLIVLLLSSRLFCIVNGQQQYRNIFVLKYRKGGADVTIIERQLQLEIFSDSECSVIRSIIRKTILETEKRLSFDVDSITIEDSFPCSCNPLQRESRHIVYTGPPARALCGQTTKRCVLREQELRWLQSSAGMPLL